MLKTRSNSFTISPFLIILAIACFSVILLHAVRLPAAAIPKFNQQILQFEADKAADSADTVYQKTLENYLWSQPVCAVTAGRTPYKVYLDDVLLYEYTPGTFDHGGMVHWISLPDTQLAGRRLSVCASSDNLTVLAGDYGDLLLYLRTANTHTLIFSGLFALLSILIFLLSAVIRIPIGAKKIRMLLYLGALMFTVSLWVSMDAAVFPISGAVMYVLAMYAFMSMPVFLIQFYRSMLEKDSRLLSVIYRLNLLNLCICSILQALGVAQLHEMLPLTHILIIIMMFALLRHLVLRLHSEFRLDAKVMLSGFGSLGFFCAVGFLNYYLGDKSLYLILLSIGMILFTISLTAVAVGYVYREMVKSSQLRYYQNLANTDLMTQLNSRTAFEELVRTSPLLKGSCACLVMDINNLKQINDTMGHSAGDKLICDAAECILSVFKSTGRCYRMGGDEFTILIEDVTEAQVKKAISELDLCINRKNLTRPFRLSVAVGYATGQDASIEKMFNDADALMYKNKTQMKQSEVKQ